MKDATELETCKKIYFYVMLHLLTIKIQHAKRVLILEFYDVTCKPAKNNRFDLNGHVVYRLQYLSM